MDFSQIKAIIENILFVADQPVGSAKFASLLGKDVSPSEIDEALAELKTDFENRAIGLVEVAEGYRLETRAEYAEWITAFFKLEKGRMLGRAALEVLAIAAYKQPLTRAEVDEIRGVDSGAALRGLVDKKLVKTMGRSKAPGKPMMYGTTTRFLEYFGLSKLTDLPTIDEFRQELDEAFPMDKQENLDLETDIETINDNVDETSVASTISGEDHLDDGDNPVDDIDTNYDPADTDEGKS